MDSAKPDEKLQEGLTIDMNQSPEERGFYGRLCSGKEADSNRMDTWKLVTTAYGYVCITFLSTMLPVLYCYSSFPLSMYFGPYYIDFILLTVSFITAYAVVYRRAVVHHVEKLVFTDIVLIAFCLFSALITIINRLHTQHLVSSLTITFNVLLVSYLLRRFRYCTRCHPLVLLIVAALVIATAQILVMRFILFVNFNVERVVYPVLYMLVMCIYIDCALHFAARTMTEEFGSASIAGVVHRTFLGIPYFQYIIVARLELTAF